jgi:cysteinyl-tRNA synthetase
LDSLARRFAREAHDYRNLARKNSLVWSSEGETLYRRISELLDNDFDSPMAVAELFDAVTVANTLADGGDAHGASELARDVAQIFSGMGLSLGSGTQLSVDDETQGLVIARDTARNSKNWAEADRLRDELVSRGWIVEDSPVGTKIRR